MTNTANRLPTYDDLIQEIGEYGGVNDLPRVRAARDAHQERLDSILRQVEQRGDNSVNASEQRAFDAHRSQIRQLDGLFERYQARSDRASAVHAGSTERGQISGTGRFYTSGGHTYRKGDHTSSWVKDMAAFGLRGDPEAAERLHRNNREVAVETRALSTTDGAGGDFSPPVWLMNEYAIAARAARVTANLVRNEQLPPGTDSINVPKILTGTAVAEQATQNTAVQNTDATTGTVTAGVATFAGQQVVSLQLIEQSPLNIDSMLLQDLTADLAAKVNLFVLNNAAANKKGLLQETGTNAVTYTSASPTVAGFYPKLADAIRQIVVGRYMGATAIIMSPIRWAWLLAATDTSGRPLVVPDAGGPMNSMAQTDGVGNAATGRVGQMLGLPIFIDPLIPLNGGAGTNEDKVIVLKADDSFLWESTLRAEAFREPTAANLSILLRVYEYAAFTAARFPKSTSVISGTGMVVPTL